MVRECIADGCSVLTMGDLCVYHEQEAQSLREAAHASAGVASDEAVQLAAPQ
jgi:hypothetical protein